MTKLLFIRHGESTYNNLKKFTGHKDVPLSALGEQQAAATAVFVLENYRVDKLYSSDLSRAVATVQPIADALGMDIYTDARFREVDLGLWTDVLIADVKEKDTETYLRYRAGAPAPGGESFLQMQARVYAATLEIAKRHFGKTVVIASHGGAIRALLVKLKNTDMSGAPVVSNASVSEIFFNGENLTLGKLSQDAHLADMYSAQDAFAN